MEIQIITDHAKIIVKVTSFGSSNLGDSVAQQNRCQAGYAKGYLAIIGIYTVHIHTMMWSSSSLTGALNAQPRVQSGF